MNTTLRKTLRHPNPAFPLRSHAIILPRQLTIRSLWIATMAAPVTAGLKRVNTEDGSVSPPAVKRRQQSTTTNKAVANFFTPASKKPPNPVTWRIPVNDTLIVGHYDASSNLTKQAGKPKDREDTKAALTTPSETTSPNKKKKKTKIAAFDFDGTLVTSASGLKFTKDPLDWRWWSPHVPPKLRALAAEGYTLVIVSNQAGITLKRKKPKDPQPDARRLEVFKRKVEAALADLDLELSVYAATERDGHRKPAVGMWNEFLGDRKLLEQEDVDLEGSVFVGDAGGRAGSGSGGVGRDHSCCDRYVG